MPKSGMVLILAVNKKKKVKVINNQLFIGVLCIDAKKIQNCMKLTRVKLKMHII